MNIFEPHSERKFEEIALQSFREQYKHVEVYHKFVKYLGIDKNKVNDINSIPFLPVELFKTHKIYDKREHPKLIFTSSGTTGIEVSRHYISDPALYKTSFIKSFSRIYGSPENYYILALLPSYLEREGSSLIYMVKELMRISNHEENGFYLRNMKDLTAKIKTLKNSKRKILLIGVSYALLDLAEKFPQDLSNAIIMETGGMKGKRKEITREELHEKLCNAFNAEKIHSEYGMTELLSQAYSFGDGKYFAPPWMKILTKDPHDPMDIMHNEKTGRINIIDLANQHSCSFIATSDIGKVHKDGSFEILGRIDSADLRGCNLMVL